MTNPPDYLEDYKAEYGYLGPALVSAVAKARTQPSTPVATVASTVPSSSIAGMTATINRNVSAPSIVQQVHSYSCLKVLLNEEIFYRTHRRQVER